MYAGRATGTGGAWSLGLNVKPIETANFRYLLRLIILPVFLPDVICCLAFSKFAAIRSYIFIEPKSKYSLITCKKYTYKKQLWKVRQ